MRTLAAQIRGGLRVGATGRPIRAVVNLGIGGSDLGPLLVCSALAPPPRTRGSTGLQTQGVDVSFVANVDPEHLTRALAPLDPATTMFIVTSKTFTTQETLANAASARAWLVAALGKGVDVNSHFVAVTGNAAAAKAFGVASADILPLWDWVGGRYSLWSPAGLPIALKLGWERFEKLLAGAASVDAHFREEPFERNLPVLLGLVGWWNAAHLRHAERVVVPYAQALFRLPAYLQQLVLESNGKRVARDGGALAGPTSPALWGEAGTNGQHAFFQWLHQGTREAPVEFIVPISAAHPLADQQTLLVANALAQAQALAGRPESRGDPGGTAGERGGRGRPRRGRRRARVPGQPRVDDAADARTQRLSARPAARALRASDLRRSRAVRHQSVRPIRRRTRQDARRTDRGGPGRRNRAAAGDRCLDARARRARAFPLRPDRAVACRSRQCPLVRQRRPAKSDRQGEPVNGRQRHGTAPRQRATSPRAALIACASSNTAAA